MHYLIAALATTICLGGCDRWIVKDISKQDQAELRVHRISRTKVGSVCRMIAVIGPVDLKTAQLWLREQALEADRDCRFVAVYAADSDAGLIDSLEYTTAIGDESTPKERYHQAIEIRQRASGRFLMAWRIGQVLRISWQWDGSVGQSSNGSIEEEVRGEIGMRQAQPVYWWLSDYGNTRYVSFNFKLSDELNVGDLIEFTDSFRLLIGCSTHCDLRATFSTRDAVLSDSMLPLGNQLIVRQLDEWSALVSSREVVC
ncbi:MAG: hypothetical protein KJZ84_14175 [Bryobacteraceae bacterium]|nr:hypothetical protein [Bryobacteraceae bacterium]